MNKIKILSYVFVALAVILSDIMCAVVAYNYCDMLWRIKYAGNSAPAEVAFTLAIPFGIGIVVCILMAGISHKKAK